VHGAARVVGRLVITECYAAAGVLVQAVLGALKSRLYVRAAWHVHPYACHCLGGTIALVVFMSVLSEAALL
jgi:hypothetical protein